MLYSTSKFINNKIDCIWKVKIHQKLFKIKCGYKKEC